MKNLLQMDKYPNIQTIAELKDFLRCSLGNNVDLLPYGTVSSGTYALLSYICNYVTQGELAYMLGPYYLHNSTWMVVKRATDRGYIQKYKLKNPDLCATMSYHLTKDGAEAYLSNLIDSLISWNGVDQDKRTKARGNKKGDSASDKTKLPFAPMHDYGVGLSLLALITLRLPIDVDKEISYMSYDGKTKLRMDAQVKLKDYNGIMRRVLYLEQDMGTESARELLIKLIKYKRCNLCSAESCVIISCHSPSGNVRVGGFSAATMRRLYSDFKAGGYSTVYEYYVACLGEMPMEDTASLEEMLIAVNDGKCERVNGGCLIVEEVMSEGDFETYINGLESGNNPFLIRRINARVTLNAKETMYALWEKLKEYRSDNEAFNALTDGWQVFVLPSILLANSATLFNGDRNGIGEYLMAISSNYFESSEHFYPCENSKDKRIWGVFEDDNSRWLSPRNLFSTTAGNTFSIEHVGRDVGAFARCLAYSMMRNLQDNDIHVIAVFDTLDDFIRFSRLVPCIPDRLSKEKKQGFRFSVMFECAMCADGTNILFKYDQPFEENGKFLNVRIGKKPEMIESIQNSISQIRSYKYRNYL